MTRGFSRVEILEEFVEASRLGSHEQRTPISDRARVLAASRERFALWLANPANRERRRLRMKRYNRTAEVRARQSARNQRQDVKDKHKATRSTPEALERRRERMKRKT